MAALPHRPSGADVQEFSVRHRRQGAPRVCYEHTGMVCPGLGDRRPVITGSDGEDGDDTLPSGTVKVWREGTRVHHPEGARSHRGGGGAAGRRAFVTGSRDGM